MTAWLSHVWVQPSDQFHHFHNMGKKQSGSGEKKSADKKAGTTKNADKNDQSEGKVSRSGSFTLTRGVSSRVLGKG